MNIDHSFQRWNNLNLIKILVFFFILLSYGQNLAANILKHLVDQLEQRILRTDQSKNALKHLHRVDRISCYIRCWN